MSTIGVISSIMATLKEMKHLEVGSMYNSQAESIILRNFQLPNKLGNTPIIREVWWHTPPISWIKINSVGIARRAPGLTDIEAGGGLDLSGDIANSSSGSRGGEPPSLLVLAPSSIKYGNGGGERPPPLSEEDQPPSATPNLVPPLTDPSPMTEEASRLLHFQILWKRSIRCRWRMSILLLLHKRWRRCHQRRTILL
ncbi:hypothetical protein LWI29_002338 [Acer saccharum]|uniref:Uncharacterized protein n=1 Tax=Acer saccharum TaxID=4024 RepID=A0AA39W5N1_ACESA|nr:hypothetical protein LWI29_002338 [Acer saccharum]